MNPHVQAILLGEKQNSESAQKLKYKVLKHYGLLTKELEVVNEYRGEYDLYMKSEQNPNEYILYRYKAIEVTDEEYGWRL